MHDTLNGDGGNRDEWVEHREQESIAAQDPNAKFESKPVDDRLSMKTKLVLWLGAWVVISLYVYANGSSREVFLGILILNPLNIILGVMGDYSENMVLKSLMYVGCLYYIILTTWGLRVKQSRVFFLIYIIFYLSLAISIIFSSAALAFNSLHPS